MLDAIKVYYTDRLVADSQSYSPSAGKPLEVCRSWRRQFKALQFVQPMAATPEQLALAHDPDYVRAVLALRKPNGFGNHLPEVAAALPYTTGSMIAAAREAMATGLVAVAPVSGFHHACYEQGGGYCTFNGLVVAARVLRREVSRVRRVGILDFDQHYGNGTTDICKRLSLDWIEHYSAAAHWDQPEQAETFLQAIPKIVRQFKRCNLLLYQAGADPHYQDPLGGWLTTEQLRERDRLVFETCRAMQLPIAWNLAGGYQTSRRKVVDIHDNTMRECLAVYTESGSAAFMYK